MTCHLDRGSLLYGGRGASCVWGATAWWTGVLAQCKGGVEGWKYHTTLSPHSPLQSCPLSSR